MFSQTLTPRQQTDRLRSVKGAELPVDLTYAYTARSQIASVNDQTPANIDQTFTYDGIGRLTASTGPWGNGVFQYDGLGNIRMRLVGTRALYMGYDASNRLFLHTDTIHGARGLSYDARGNVTQIGTVSFGYDSSDQPVSMTRAPPSDVPDVTSFTSVGAALINGVVTSGQRLVSPDGNYSAALTHKGELLIYYQNKVIWRSDIRTETGSYTMYAQGDCNLVIYNASSQPVWHTHTNCPSSTTLFQMQADGNLVLYRNVGGSWQPAWDAGTYGQTGATSTGSYTYDGHLRRVKQVAGGVTRYSVYDAGGGLVEIDEVGGAKKDYIRASGMTLARIAGSTVTWLHHDHLGSAVAGTNSAGAVVWRESEQPFGEDWVSAAANDNQAGYTGHVEDAATGLVYMQARYYDPVIGRFLSIDPVGFSPGRPSMFNRYAYAGNDPVNMWDPDGRSYMKCKGDSYDCKFEQPFGRPDIGSQQLGGGKGGKGGKGERGRTGKASGTDNEDKKFKPGKEPGTREWKDLDSGKKKQGPWPQDPRKGGDGTGVHEGSSYPEGGKVFEKPGKLGPVPGLEFSISPGPETVPASGSGVSIEEAAIVGGAVVVVAAAIACAVAEPCGAIAVATILGGGTVGLAVAQ